MNRALEIYAEKMIAQTNPVPDNDWCRGFHEGIQSVARFILEMRDEEIEAEHADAVRRGVTS